jgi:hypothetical protein
MMYLSSQYTTEKTIEFALMLFPEVESQEAKSANQ